MRYIAYMAMRDSISIRFPNAVREDLEQIARSSGLTAADLIRLATVDYIRRAHEDGSLSIPLPRLGLVAERAAEPYGAKQKKK
jgi:hypothetical protein